MTRTLVAPIALGLLIAACSPAPSAFGDPSPVTTSVAIATTEPSPQQASPEPPGSPSAGTSEPAFDSVPIPADTYARVVTDDLRVRSNPGVSGDSKKLEPLLDRNVLLLVLDGPVQASGFDWYQVKPIYSFEHDTGYPFGWVAAADKHGEPWIQPDSVTCPAPPTTLDEFAHVFEVDELFLQITCFSGLDITLKGWLTTPSEWCGLGAEVVVEPLWIDECGTASQYLVDAADQEWDHSLHPAWAPDVDLSIAPPAESSPEEWPRVEVTGQFDHPDARTCRPVDADSDFRQGGFEPVTFTCRLRFVVTSMRPVED